jgi:hypothetical protein
VTSHKGKTKWARMAEARPELVPTAQAWVAWTETYLEENQPADPLFFEPLIERGTNAFWRYHAAATHRGW